MKAPTLRPPSGSSRREEAHSSQSAIGNRKSAILLAFTRLELLAVLAALAFLAAVVLPTLANTRPRSDRVVCANNLRQISMGYQLWGNDHDDQPPWEIPLEQGGTQLHSLGANAWLHFAWISNELNSARVLLCPSDSGRAADDFSGSPNGGYLHPNYRNAATSYFLTHAFYGGTFAVFAGDRNLGSDGVTGCSRFPQVISINMAGPALAWDTTLHNQAGNMVRFDGRVNQYSNNELRLAATADPIGDDTGQLYRLHVVKPR